MKRKSVRKSHKDVQADLFAKITARVAEYLEKGIIPWEQPWGNTIVEGGAFNLETGRPYEFVNVFSLDHPKDGYITFNGIKRLGVRLKKNFKETSHAELVYGTFFKKYAKIDKETGEQAVDEDGNPEWYRRYQLVYWVVYWEGDIDWNKYEPITYSEYRKLKKENPELVECFDHEEKDENGNEVTVKEYLKIVGQVKKPTRKKRTAEIAEIEDGEELIDYYSKREGMHIYRDKPSKEAFYSPSGDYIQIPMLKQYKHANEYYSTAFHEMTHSTGHYSRLNRLKSDAFFGSHNYSKEELVAEMGSAMLCSYLGIETAHTFKNSTAYIQSWLKALNDDKTMFYWACKQAEKAVKFILGVEEEQEEVEGE